ncbi:hypothetical protein ABPG77_008097 [Micractinium sp. CCAP 211/92]
MAPLQQGCRRRRAPAASLVLASLLLIAAAARLPTAAAQRASPSPSPEESPSPSPEESPSPSPEESPSPSPDASPSPYPDASPSPSPDVGPAPSPISLDYPANRNADNQPVLTVTKANIDGRDVYYEVPQAVKGMYVFFHGCAHNGYDHWPPQPGCPECRGLPGEVAITKQALSLGYAFMTINSLDRRPVTNSDETARCFSYNADHNSAAAAIRSLRSQLGLDDKPLYFGGVSSGGGFAIKLINKMQGEVSGITSIVLGLDFSNAGEGQYDWSSWPPVAFIAMARDKNMAKRIADTQKALTDAGVPSQTITVQPRVVYWPTYFSDQSADIDAEMSANIVSALVDIGVIGPMGFVTDDPRHGFQNLPWRAELIKQVPELDGTDPSNSLTADSSDVYELLNLAYADHEIDGEYFTAIQKWMEGGFSGNLPAMGEKYIIRQPSQLSAARLQPDQLPATSGDPPVTPWISPPAAAPSLAPTESAS